MDFKFYLTEHIKKHPSVMPQDIIKACYQSVLGAEHLVCDVSAAKKNFDAEFEEVLPREGELFEVLSDCVCRVDLGVWKREGLPSNWLFNMFFESAKEYRGEIDTLRECIFDAESVLSGTNVNFSNEEWSDYVERYISNGMCAVHHSDEYRKSEEPSYRIVGCRFLNCLPLLLAAAKLPESKDGRPKIIAIDGRAASGKTTLADILSKIIGAEKVRMDDFFLPLPLRTSERLAEAGGNIHYERFAKEVIPDIREQKAFSYGVFDCGKMEIDGERFVGESAWRIVEGSYSHHPKFGDYADLKIFCTVDSEEQMRRITVRNGERLAERFKNEWIPMEERYFSSFNVRENADIII